MLPAPKSIGIILASTRAPRICPQIADFVVKTIETDATHGRNSIQLKMIDLKDWPLPFYDEPGIPSRIFDHNEYSHEHTKAWSREIQQHDAFIFVTPQYNWGYPAVLKNAIDYLFNEWKGKPAMIVTYGGHGGGKCGIQLRGVLNGIDMTVVQQHVELSFPSKDVLVKAATGQQLGLDGSSSSGPWSSERVIIRSAYNELVNLLYARPIVRTVKRWRDILRMG